MLYWGWRIPYLTSVAPGVAIIFARRYLEETGDFESLLKEVVEQKKEEAGSAAEKGSAWRKGGAGADLAAGSVRPSTTASLLKDHKLPLIIGSLGTAGIGSMWYV